MPQIVQEKSAGLRRIENGLSVLKECGEVDENPSSSGEICTSGEIFPDSDRDARLWHCTPFHE
jgi:hypothetical protein